MNDLISRYLRYGCSFDFPEVKKIPDKTSVDYHKTKDELRKVVSESILKINPENVLFQLSGGFDSTVIVSHFENIRTFCINDIGNQVDRIYSKRASRYFDTEHIDIDQRKLFDRIDFKDTVMKMAEINPYPRCFKNDFVLFAYLDYIRELTDSFVTGMGIEFQLLGYHNIYNKIIELAISKNEYSMETAKRYFSMRDFESTEDGPLNMDSVIDGKYSLDMVGWWTGIFTKKQVKRLTGKEIDIEFDTLNEIIDFMFEWFGREYVNNRMRDFSNYFNITCHIPYVDDDMVSFVKTIPIELRKCMDNHKYIFYQAMGDMVPDFVMRRPKEGLNTSFGFFDYHKREIDELVDIYVKNKGMKVYNYIDFSEAISYLDDFSKAWSLLNLSIWIENNK